VPSQSVKPEYLTKRGKNTKERDDQKRICSEDLAKTNVLIKLKRDRRGEAAAGIKKSSFRGRDSILLEYREVSIVEDGWTFLKITACGDKDRLVGKG